MFIVCFLVIFYISVMSRFTLTVLTNFSIQTRLAYTLKCFRSESNWILVISFDLVITNDDKYPFLGIPSVGILGG